MHLDYETPPLRRSAEGAVYVVLLRIFVAYFVISILTLPLLDAWWIGELPVLALVQLPKISLANWIRTELVMAAVRKLGLSRGSFSPDFSMARPYALAIVYSVPVGILLAVIRVRRTRLAPKNRRWRWAVLIAAVIDFAFTLFFASGHSLTIY